MRSGSESNEVKDFYYYCWRYFNWNYFCYSCYFIIFDLFVSWTELSAREPFLVLFFNIEGNCAFDILLLLLDMSWVKVFPFNDGGPIEGISKPGLFKSYKEIWPKRLINLSLSIPLLETFARPGNMLIKRS